MAILRTGMSNGAIPLPGVDGVDGYADLGELRLHYVTAGHGPLVVLLHGFPEFWYSWRHQISVLARAGYRVVAADMRGYNLSDKPRGASAYAAWRVADDVARLVEALGEQRAVVVGHDWGGTIAWLFGMRHPGRTSGLVSINSPHPASLRRALTHVDQFLRSSYVLFFRLPWLPELTIRAGDFALVRRILRVAPARPGTFSEEEIDRYVAALSQPGALTAALNYYRALARPGGIGLRENLRPIVAPALVIWGERDPYLRPELADPARRWVPAAAVRRFAELGHWPHLEDPATVNAALLAFLDDVDPGREAP